MKGTTTIWIPRFGRYRDFQTSLNVVLLMGIVVLLVIQHQHMLSCSNSRIASDRMNHVLSSIPDDRLSPAANVGGNENDVEDAGNGASSAARDGDDDHGDVSATVARVEKWYDNIPAISDFHPAFVPMVDEYHSSGLDWHETNMPDINIVGEAKAGTSQMYKIISSHPGAIKFDEIRKEHCLTSAIYWSRSKKNLRRKNYLQDFRRDDYFGWEQELLPRRNADTRSAKELNERRRRVQRIYHKWHKSFHKEMLRQRSNKDDGGIQTQQQSVNACLFWHEVQLNWYYLHLYHKNRYNSTAINATAGDGDGTTTEKKPKKRTTKFIMIFRDIADILWSRYTYFKDERIDARFRDTRDVWTDGAELFYRSPALFHEFVVSGNRTKFGEGLDTAAYRITMRAKNVRSLADSYGGRGEKRRDNDGENDAAASSAAMPQMGVDVLFLRNEDMKPDVADVPGGVVDKLSAFTGLPRSGFKEGDYKSMTNCNDSKGLNQNCGSSSSSYKITNNQKMLPETRRLIYRKFWKHCYAWYTKFGIEYPDCLMARPKWYQKYVLPQKVQSMDRTTRSR